MTTIDHLLERAKNLEEQEVASKRNGDRLTEDILHQETSKAWELYLAEWHRQNVI